MVNKKVYRFIGEYVVKKAKKRTREAKKDKKNEDK